MHLLKNPACFLAPDVPSIASSSGRSIAVFIAIASLFVAAPAFAQFGTNLVVNGGAEDGPGSTGGSAVTSIPGWSLSFAPTVVNYANNAGFPTATSPGPAGRGAQFFAGGWSANSSLSQTIDVGFAASEIDSKSVIFDFSGWVGGYATDNDHAYVQIHFFSESWSYFGSVPLAFAYVNAAARKNITGMLLKQTSGVVPAGTSRIVITVDFNRAAGASSDGYVDNLYLSLRNAGE